MLCAKPKVYATMTGHQDEKAGALSHSAIPSDHRPMVVSAEELELGPGVLTQPEVGNPFLNDYRCC